MNAPTDSDLSLDQLVERDRRRQEAADGQDSTGGDDDHITLPWWQHPMNIVTVVVTTAIIAAMIGWMIGDANAQPQHDEVDTGFLQDMRVHHEQAVLMSLIYRNLPDIDPGLRTVARTILVGQSQEVGRMAQLLQRFGESPVNEDGTAMEWMGMVAGIENMPGMATADELDTLGRLDGRAADELFVQLMTEHHEGGIDMAEFTATAASNETVRELAAAMASAQRDEIVEMESLLEP